MGCDQSKLGEKPNEKLLNFLPVLNCTVNRKYDQSILLIFQMRCAYIN